MCLQNLIARRRANDIIRQKYGLVCKSGCDYKNLLLYQFVLKCPTEQAGFPPFSGSDLPASPEQTTDCSLLVILPQTVPSSTDLCTGEVNIDFVEPVFFTDLDDEGPVSEEDVYEQEIIGAGTLALPPDVLLQVLVFKAAVDTTVKVGTTFGGEEVVFELPITAGTIYSHTSNLYFESGIILYFEGTYNVKVFTRGL